MRAKPTSYKKNDDAIRPNKPD